MLERENAFWTFSLAVYAQPGVADECLSLQSRFHIDVNVLLFCVWIGVEKKITLGESDFSLIDAQVTRWHQAVVVPLRAVRQAMKFLPELSHQQCANLRKDVAKAELRAEQIEQAFLFELADQIAGGQATVQNAIEDNVSRYLQRCAESWDNSALPTHLIAAAAMSVSGK